MKGRRIFAVVSCLVTTVACADEPPRTASTPQQVLDRNAAASVAATPLPAGGSQGALASTPKEFGTSCGATEWKHLPLAQFTRSTLVDDNCLVIPKGTVSVGAVNPSCQDVTTANRTLIIVARRGLRFEEGATIDAHGASGCPGKASTHTTVYPRGRDNAGDACLCTRDANELAQLAGANGDAGDKGGQIRIIAMGVELASKPGVSIVVRGGTQGDHGQCGVTDCPKFPGHSSPCCPNYPAPSVAPAGSVYMALGTTDAMRDLLASGVVPQLDGSRRTVTATVVDVQTAFKMEIDRALSEASTNGYDIKQGI